LKAEEITSYIDAELKDSGAQRVVAAAPNVEAPRQTRARRQKSLDPKEEFMRMLRLSGLDTDGMADETRDTFVNMAENLGMEAADAEELIDQYLDETDKMAEPEVLEPVRGKVVHQPVKTSSNGHAAPVAAPVAESDRQRF